MGGSTLGFLLSASAYTRLMRVMTAHLDEALTLNANELRGLVPNGKLFRPKHTILPVLKIRPYWNGPTEVGTGFVIL